MKSIYYFEMIDGSLLLIPESCGAHHCQKAEFTVFITVRNRKWEICFMVTILSGNIFRVTGSLCGEFTCRRWIPLTEASDAKLWYFPWSAPEQTVE